MLDIFGGGLLLLAFWFCFVVGFSLLAGCSGNAAATAPVCLTRCDVSASVTKGGAL